MPSGIPRCRSACCALELVRAQYIRAPLKIATYCYPAGELPSEQLPRCAPSEQAAFSNVCSHGRHGGMTGLCSDQMSCDSSPCCGGDEFGAQRVSGELCRFQADPTNMPLGLPQSHTFIRWRSTRLFLDGVKLSDAPDKPRPRLSSVAALRRYSAARVSIRLGSPVVS